MSPMCPRHIFFRAGLVAFLSQPVSVAQRWAKDGMPLERRGRFVTATPEELDKWLGREVGGEPVQVATPDLDLSKELKRGLAFVRKQRSSESSDSTVKSTVKMSC